MDIKKIKAWGIHTFTASGVIFGMLAMLAVIEGDANTSLMWLGVALLIDGFDGTLARRYDVKHITPEFDGVVLDLIIDYLTYVFVPAFFIYKFIPLPEYTLTLSMIIILVSSFFCFCNANMKSKDNYFVGFPATWNIVAFCFIIIDPPAWASFTTIIILAALSVVPIKFLHPFRVRKAMPINISATLIWLITSGILIAQYDQGLNRWILAAWWLSGIYFLAFGIIQTILSKTKTARN